MSHYSGVVQSGVFSEIEDSSSSGCCVNERTLQGQGRTHTAPTPETSAAPAPAIGNPLNEKQAAHTGQGPDGGRDGIVCLYFLRTLVVLTCVVRLLGFQGAISLVEGIR